jgi:8-oxo-dGTP diphosphatase
VSRAVHVAVGVIVGKDGTILIAKRPEKTHQGGLWEFPGGKVEQGETLFNALKRELQEELAIEVVSTEPLIKIRHDYGDKVVLLDVHKVTQFSGQPQGNEGQPIQWVTPAALHNYEFPAANRPIITAINIPQRLLITGEFTELNNFLIRIESALKQGIRLVQLRLQKAETIPMLMAPVAEICKRYSAKLSINTSPHVFASLSTSFNCGLHLNSTQLLNCNNRPVSAAVLLGASCHTKNEIEHAEKIGVDYVCLSPVLATTSHPNQNGMGWDAFRLLVEDATIPVYALGGMTESDLAIAVECGAQGIAAISEWWQ